MVDFLQEQTKAMCGTTRTSVRSLGKVVFHSIAQYFFRISSPPSFLRLHGSKDLFVFCFVYDEFADTHNLTINPLDTSSWSGKISISMKRVQNTITNHLNDLTFICIYMYINKL